MPLGYLDTGITDLASVAGRTRLLDRCRTRRETDRQQAGTVVLSSDVADADSPVRSARRWPWRISPHPSSAWARGYFDELIRSRAEGGGRTVETGPPSPDKRHQEGDRGRVRMSSPRGTARGRHVARPIRLSVGRRVALNRNYLPQCYNSDSRTELTYSNSRSAPAAPRRSRDCAP